jgi:hypothetical protein
MSGLLYVYLLLFNRDTNVYIFKYVAGHLENQVFLEIPKHLQKLMPFPEIPRYFLKVLKF